MSKNSATCPTCHMTMVPAEFKAPIEGRLVCKECKSELHLRGRYWELVPGKPWSPDNAEYLEGLFGFSVPPKELPTEP